MKYKSYTECGLKICSDCKIAKDKSMYYSNPSKYDGIKNICIDCDNIRNKKYRENNKEKEVVRRRLKYLKYKERELIKSNEYKSNKLKNDSGYRLLVNLRSRHYQAVKNAGKDKKFRTTDLLGCTANELKKYIESQFTGEMSWENQGSYWHVDHIYPLSKIDWDNREQVKMVCHYTNLRPMIASENISKGNKII